MKLTNKQLVKCNETLKDFVCLIPRYLEVKDNDELYDMFLSRNRNPLFDLTNTKFWETGLSSNGAKVNGVKVVKDHYIPRKIAMGYIMEELSNNPEISLNDFVLLCKKYASTVSLSEDEHSLITIRAKNTGKCNYEFYSECGIIIEGMDDLVVNL
jgi:hypothetical protein